MDGFSIGLSAIQAGQSNLNVIGQNLANATTPGYNQETVNLVNQSTNGVGTGVDVASITRYTAPPLQTAILQGNADEANSTAQLGIQQQVQTAITAGGTSTSTFVTYATLRSRSLSCSCASACRSPSAMSLRTCPARSSGLHASGSPR